MRNFLTIIIFATALTGCFGWYEMPVWSMEPTIMHGAKIKIDSGYYESNPIERFDIVGYIRPDNQEVQVKRIIGMGGEKIKIEGGVVFINGREIQEPMQLEPTVNDFPEFTIPPQQYFLLGDNRNRSNDSRMWGPLAASSITGKVSEIKNP